MIKKMFVYIGALSLTFVLCFFLVTALLDWVCHASDYYQQAEKDVVVLED